MEADQRRRGALVVLTLLAIILPFGCAKPKPPTIKAESATVTGISPGGVTTKIVLSAFNSNPFPLVAQRMTATVTFDRSVSVGPVDAPTRISLPSEKWSKIEVEATASWKSAASLAALAARSPSLPYEVRGTVGIGGHDVSLDVPFTLKGTVRRSELVSAGISGLRRARELPLSLPE